MPPVTVSVDWLAFTYFPKSDYVQDEIAHFLGANFGAHEWVPSERGWQGYERSARCEGALIAWGGEYQRGSVHLELPGQLCSGCRDWGTVVEWLELWGAKLTRVDIAGDDYFGERMSVDWAIAAFHSGGFTTAGRPPVPRLVDDLGSGAGRTLYVGKRENGKLCRVYEKGRQLGDKLSKWVRLEVEWRAKDRFLPFVMLTEPAKFLSGTYPVAAFFAEFSEVVRTIKARAVISYQKMVSVARQHAGRAISAMLMVARGDVGEVVNLLRRSGLPSRVNAAEIYALTGGT